MKKPVSKYHTTIPAILSLPIPRDSQAFSDFKPTCWPKLGFFWPYLNANVSILQWVIGLGSNLCPLQRRKMAGFVHESMKTHYWYNRPLPHLSRSKPLLPPPPPPRPTHTHTHTPFLVYFIDVKRENTAPYNMMVVWWLAMLVASFLMSFSNYPLPPSRLTVYEIFELCYLDPCLKSTVSILRFESILVDKI